jgi:hypothetical protein
VVVGKPGSPPPDFFAPKKSAKLVYGFVRDHGQQPCTAPRVATTHNAPLTFPACSPTAPTSTLEFGPKGGGAVSMQGKVKGALADVLVSIKMKDVRDASGNPFSGTLTFKTGVRVTHPACLGGAACTRTDQQISVPVQCDSKGKCQAKKVAAGLSLSPGVQSNVEIGTNRASPSTDLCLYDGSDKQFACAGFFLP